MAVDSSTLCFTVTALTTGKTLTQVCPLNLDQAWKGLTLDPAGIKHLYGLGEQFLPQRFGSSDGDWMGQVRFPSVVDDQKGAIGKFGNEMVNFPPGAGSGAVGNTEFPILYAMNADNSGYSLFLDQIYKQRWDFKTNPKNGPWKVEMEGPQIRGFFTAGQNLPTLRKAFMDLIGHPLVPPKKAFGLWVSQFGFVNWAEMDDWLKTLREHHFPLDGFVMDLQWFGGVKNNSGDTRMGTLDFDTTPDHFPKPAEKIRALWNNQGVGIIPIEESYIGKNLREFDDLAQRGFLVRATPTSDPLVINENPWWGVGGMIDWSVPGAGAYWHQAKRQNLVNLGVVGHWTDLGEPEMYRHVENVGGNNVYTIPYNAAETHNLFSLMWHESIFNGYRDSGSVRRPFILSRSGGPGMERYGAAMWSGDIGSKFENLATHYNVQMEMSLSGLDYFGADVGGFHREDLNGGNINELYSQWFADACAFDVPVRPHTENLNKTKPTAPDRVGDLESNLNNIRLRYELSPYYYSLAHEAYLNAEPVVPPLFFYYPDSKDKVMGSEKLIGPSLLTAVVAKAGQKTRDIYLPSGDWINYHTLHWQTGTSDSGQVLQDFPIYHRGHLELPLFAKAGAIIPRMLVDDQTMNILGKRLDGVTHTELIARIFPSVEPTRFTIFEDDGTSTAYQQGAFSETTVTQVFSGRQIHVEVSPTSGKYTYEDPNTGVNAESPTSRQFQIEVVMPPSVITGQVRVTLDDQPLPRLNNEKEFAAASSGYFISS